MGLYQELKDRGLIAQMTHEEEIIDLLDNKKVTFYIGFDPTADSLHIGHFLQMVVMAHMQKAGHRPIAIVGGGTAMVGDPSGRSDMRQMMTPETIEHNANCFKGQLAKLVDFSEGKALMVNNADWLMNLNYIEFLREIGVHFSVNKMLSAECFKTRMEKGLSFIEFNYMLMQSYDFLKLNRDYGCVLELGGDDQWSNIIGGIELIRKCEGKSAYGMTFTLLTTSEGKKMGKTQKGALWLDPNKTTPYEFYQYFRNVDDKDVINCMKLITFIPLSEIAEYEKLEGSEINKAKMRLAFEVTKMVHGEEEAKKAEAAALSLFAGGAAAEVPTYEIEGALVKEGVNIMDVMVMCGLAPSKSEARRNITQGGVTLNDEKVTDLQYAVKESDFTDNSLMIKRGKKAYKKIIIK